MRLSSLPSRLRISNLYPLPPKTRTLSKSLNLIPSSAPRCLLSSLSSVKIVSTAATTEDFLRKSLPEIKAAINAHADAVRRVKNHASADKAEFDAGVADINVLKIKDGASAKRLQAAGSVNREALRMVLKRNHFYRPSFNGWVAGPYDHYLQGRAIKHYMIEFWRKHFILKEGMLQLSFSSVIPEVVLKASGHVDKFTHLVVKDKMTGTCYRADHLVKDSCKEKLEKDLTLSPEKAAELKHVIAVLGDLSPKDLRAKLKEYGITAPDTKNPLSDPDPFNLTFHTPIGPFGLLPGWYMRPMMAWKIFATFDAMYNGNENVLPFAAAQIGQAFRTEMSPRQCLLRAHQFTLAVIEHFVDPEDKSHPKFVDVAELEFLMFPKEEQLSGKSAKKLDLGEAVSKGTVNNETLGYFIGRAYLFLTHLGINKERLRFRQHLPNEMAHYAADWWVAEIECSYGWIECGGINESSAYDLKAHSKLLIVPSKKELGFAFKGSQQMVVEALESMSATEAFEMKTTLESKGEVEFYVWTLGKTVSIKKSMVSITCSLITPSVIELSFNIDRVIHCLYEHCFYIRPSKSGEEQSSVFRFPPLVAPVKCAVFPLLKNKELDDVAKEIVKSLSAAGILNVMDITGPTDELGVPFVVTVDKTTSVTIRERDTENQIRVNIDEVVPVVKALIDGQSTWADIMWQYKEHHPATAADRVTRFVRRTHHPATATDRVKSFVRRAVYFIVSRFCKT